MQPEKCGKAPGLDHCKYDVSYGAGPSLWMYIIITTSRSSSALGEH